MKFSFYVYRKNLFFPFIVGINVMRVHQNSSIRQQKKYFTYSKEHLDEFGKMQDRSDILLKTRGLNKALEHSYHQLAKTVGEYGTNHPYTTTALHHLAILHSQNGEKEFALPLFQSSNRILQQDGADDNPNNCTAYSSIGTTLFKLGHYEEALDNGLKALKLFRIDSGYDNGDPSTIRKQWQLGRIYLELGKKKQKAHDFADARHLYTEGLKHALDAEDAIHKYWPHSEKDKKYSKTVITRIKKQASTLPPPPEWLPSGTIKAMTEPFKDNKLPFTQPEPPLKAKL